MSDRSQSHDDRPRKSVVQPRKQRYRRSLLCGAVGTVLHAFLVRRQLGFGLRHRRILAANLLFRVLFSRKQNAADDLVAFVFAKTLGSWQLQRRKQEASLPGDPQHLVATRCSPVQQTPPLFRLCLRGPHPRSAEGFAAEPFYRPTRRLAGRLPEKRTLTCRLVICFRENNADYYLTYRRR